MNTLNMYNNLQYNPIKIGDYTILEFYKDSIEEYNVVGYHILPIEGLTIAEINQRINMIAQNAPEGYSSWVVLSSRNGLQVYENFNHRRCYVVYYKGTDVPTYPEEPTIGNGIEPAEAFDPWHQLGLNNEGTAPAPARISLTLTSIVSSEPVEFWINDDYFKATLPTSLDGGTLVVDKNGFIWNGQPIHDFEMTAIPRILPGNNNIKVSKKNVDRIDIFYKAKF